MPPPVDRPLCARRAAPQRGHVLQVHREAVKRGIDHLQSAARAPGRAGLAPGDGRDAGVPAGLSDVDDARAVYVWYLRAR